MDELGKRIRPPATTLNPSGAEAHGEKLPGEEEIVRDGKMRDGATAIEVGCMAHLRRRFTEALEGGDLRAAIAVEKIRKLYRVERAAREAGLDPRPRSLCARRSPNPSSMPWEDGSPRSTTPFPQESTRQGALLHRRPLAGARPLPGGRRPRDRQQRRRARPAGGLCGSFANCFQSPDLAFRAFSDAVEESGFRCCIGEGHSGFDRVVEGKLRARTRRFCLEGLDHPLHERNVRESVRQPATVSVVGHPVVNHLAGIAVKAGVDAIDLCRRAAERLHLGSASEPTA
jgi:hypothetical protein